MSRVVSIVNDELKERCGVGQGYNGFWLWTDEEDTVLALNYMLNRALETMTAIRVVDEYYGTSENWSDPSYIDPDAKIWYYNEPSTRDMQAYMDKTTHRGTSK